MSFKLIFNVIGKLLTLEAVLMIPSLIVAMVYRQGDAAPFLYSMGIILAFGLPAMLLSKPATQDVRAKEGLVAVGLAWVLLSAFGALPFMFSGATAFYWDALFETVSGFTTTGASIFSEVEHLPHGILFWRSFTHWVGGMGVLILTLAVMPKISGRGSMLARAESPGPTFSKLMPRMTDNARLMYAIYTARNAPR